MSENNDVVSISKNEYEELIAAKTERNLLERELNSVIKRSEFYKLHMETQIGLTNLATKERLKHELYTRLLLESCPIPMFVFDENLKFLLGTKSITKLINIEDVSCLHRASLDSIVDKYNLSVFTSEITKLIKSMVSSRGYGNFDAKREIATNDNKRYEISVLPFNKDADVFAGVLIVVHDITELVISKDTIQLLREKAAYDSLTRIYNRAAFKDLAIEFISKAKRERISVCLFVIDIDYFKNVNDTYGHVCGDMVLQNMSGVIKGIVRSDDLFGRLGGEEFGVLITGVSESAALNLAEKVRRSVFESNIKYKGSAISVTVSVGVSLSYPRSGLTYDTLFEQADAALYQAKDSGRNMTALFQATEGRRNISVHYQEKVKIL